MQGRVGVTAGLCCGAVALCWACLPGQTTQRIYSGDPPEPDGYNIIAYDVDVLEDDSDCGANTPYKRSHELMIVEWHSNHDVTIYTRGGLFATDASLDERGEYRYSGTGGPCLPGSHAWGRLDRQYGEGRLTCYKRECTVVITSEAFARPPDFDAGVAPDDGGMSSGDGGAGMGGSVP